MTATHGLRIMHLITDLDIGGAETMLARLVAAMDRQRFDNVVVSMMTGGALRPVIEGEGIRVTDLGMRRGMPNPMALLRLHRMLRGEQPDILQTWLYHADLIGSLARRSARTPVLAWNLRTSHLKLSRSTTLVVRVLARLAHLPDVVIFNSKAGQNVHTRMGYRPRRAEVIPNGIDVERFQPSGEARAQVRAELGLSASTLLIGLIARYDPAKDHANFFRAADILVKARRDVCFVLVGRSVDSKNAALEAAISEQHLDGRVCLLGERTDIPRLTAALDIATSSSSGEGFPTVVGEAMACGVPCVVTDVGDSRLIVDDTGRVVPVKDPNALARAWDGLVEIGVEGRAKLGAAARSRIERYYSLSTIVKRYENLYQELTSDVRPSESSGQHAARPKNTRIG